MAVLQVYNENGGVCRKTYGTSEPFLVKKNTGVYYGTVRENCLVEPGFLSPQVGDTLVMAFCLGTANVAVGKCANGDIVVRKWRAGYPLWGVVEPAEVSATTLAKCRKHAISGVKMDVMAQIQKGVVHTGTDPEVFVRSGDGKIKPAFTFLPHKDKPKSTEGMDGTIDWQTCGRTHIFYDGYQAEMSTDPKHCHSYLIDEIRNGLIGILKTAKETDNQASLDWSPFVEIDPEEMAQYTPAQNQLGCLPSFSAYDADPLDGQAAAGLPIRFAGCHIHFGFSTSTGYKADTIIGEEATRMFPRIIRALDSVHGILMMLLLDGLDDPRRRQFYGKAGEYRTPKHGLEYRVPSSAILCHPAVTHLAFDIARSVAAHVGEFKCFPKSPLEEAWKIRGGAKTVQRIIDEWDIKRARKIAEAHKPIVKAMLEKIYSASSYGGAENALRMIYAGARNVAPCEVSSMAKNWYLDSVWALHSESPNATVGKLIIPKVPELAGV